MHVNKVSRVRTIDRVAKDLDEDVDFLFDVAIEMEVTVRRRPQGPALAAEISAPRAAAFPDGS